MEVCISWMFFWVITVILMLFWVTTMILVLERILLKWLTDGSIVCISWMLFWVITMILVYLSAPRLYSFMLTLQTFKVVFFLIIILLYFIFLNFFNCFTFSYFFGGGCKYWHGGTWWCKACSIPCWEETYRTTFLSEW